MKKLMIVCCMILALALCAGAVADPVEVTGKVVLWETSAEEADTQEKQGTSKIRISFEPRSPVTLEELDTGDVFDDYICSITREGVAPVIVAISGTDKEAHHNINNYSEEDMKLYIDSQTSGMEEENYSTSIETSEAGNKYVVVEDAFSHSLVTIYDNYNISVVQISANDDGTARSLTDADRDFALEVFQGIWME